MSIIDPKYAATYKNKPKDWTASFIDDHTAIPDTREKTVKVKNEDGTETEHTETVTLKKTRLDLDALFGLAKANAIDTAEMEAQRDRKNAPGRIRMTLGNQLRAAAKHRHGLNDLNGEFHDAPADFIGDAPKTQNPDGSKIEAPKAEAPADETKAA